MADPLTAAERDAAIAALERVRRAFWPDFIEGVPIVVTRGPSDDTAWVQSIASVIDSGIARLRGEGEHG